VDIQNEPVCFFFFVGMAEAMRVPSARLS
jgi:hypothetical protein